MQPIPYLFFNGTCAEAMRAYGAILGGAGPELMTLAEAPGEVRAQMPDADPAMILHAALRVGAGWIFASDDRTGESPPMAGVSVNLSFPDPGEARRVFDALAEGGEVRMPFAPMFWTPGFGALTDRFGVRWMVMVDTPPDQGGGTGPDAT